jgi:HlyD family secretion protein
MPTPDPNLLTETSAPAPTRARRIRIPWLRLAMLALFISGVTAAVLYGPAWLNRDGNTKRPLTARVVRGELKITITDRGELESINPLQVVCELEGGGKLVSIVPEGTTIKKGKEVAKLDTDALLKAINEQEVKWEVAEGKVNSAKSELSQTKNKAKSEISKSELALTIAKIDLESYMDPQGKYTRDLDKAKGALELAKKNLKDSEDDLEFTKGLVKKGFAQLDQVRTKELAVEERRLLVTSSQADLTILEKFTRKKETTELKSKASEAEIELERTKESQATAIRKVEDEMKSATKTADIEKKQLERIRKQLDQCVITAPSDGIVLYYNARYWDENARIRPGAQLYFQQPIFTLPDLSKMFVKVKVHESVIKTVKVGNPATMKIDAIQNRMLNGKVLKIATLPQSDGWRGGGVKQYVTEVSIDDLPTEAGLKPGMTAEVRILVNTLNDALSVPVQAVAEIEGKTVCFVIQGNSITQREVKTGESNEQFIHILEGLEVDEEVTLDARLRASKQQKASEKDKGETKTNSKDATNRS